MSIFHRVVVPVDGSAPSEEAVNLALRLVKDDPAEVIFCSMIDSERVAAECASVGGDPSPIIDALTADAGRFVTSASKKAEAAGVGWKGQVSHAGDPVDGILSIARSDDADLIVMGSHGRRGLSRLVMGSTTEGVLRRSDVPVLVVRESRPEKRPAPLSAQIVADVSKVRSLKYDG